MDLHVFSSWRFCVFWQCGSTEHSSVCLLLQAPCDPKYGAYLMNWSLHLMSLHCWQCAVLRVPREARFWVLVSVLNIFTPLRPKLTEMKASPLLLRWLAKGYCLAPTLLRTFVTYRLTFMAQHALLDFLGQDQVARLRSGPLEDYNSPCVPRWA